MKSNLRQTGLILILLFVATLSPVMALEVLAPPQKQANLVMVLNPGATLRLNPAATQWLLLHQKLTAVSLRDGRLLFLQEDSRGEWFELYRLNPLEQAITAFFVKDLDADQIAEIVVGTAEPGFIYIYKFENGQWQPHNYGKYVWSNVVAISAGPFGGPADLTILVQNQEGFLYLLQPSLDSLDLVWCSPSPWRPIERFLTLDIDRDSAAEIVAVYQNSGLVLLKISHNSLISIWENFPWGKLLAVTAADWDQDQKPELIYSTSQNILYQLRWNPETQELQEKLDHFNYTIEHLTNLNQQIPDQLLTIDTNGKTHLLKFDPISRQWGQEWLAPTGRIAQVIDSSNLKALLFWRTDQRLTTLTVYPATELRLQGWGRLFPLSSGVIFKEKRIYLTPAALTVVPELKLTYSITKVAFNINYEQTKVEVNPADLGSVKLNGEKIVDLEPPLLINNQIYLSLESYQRLFGFALPFNLTEQTITIIPPSPAVPPATAPLDATSPEGDEF